MEQGEAGPLKVFGLSKVGVPQRTEKVHKMSSTVWSQQLGAMPGTVRDPNGTRADLQYLFNTINADSGNLSEFFIVFFDNFFL